MSPCGKLTGMLEPKVARCSHLNADEKFHKLWPGVLPNSLSV